MSLGLQIRQKLTPQQCARLLKQNLLLVEGNRRLAMMTFMGELGLSVNRNFLYQYLLFRDRLRELRAQIHSDLAPGDFFVDCEGLDIAVEINHSFQGTCYDVEPENCLGLVSANSPSDALKLVGSALRLLNRLINLVLRHFARPSFPHRITLREKVWSILHGSHPPKASARLAVWLRGAREGVLHCVCSPS